jgi:hypothetical protein
VNKYPVIVAPEGRSLPVSWRELPLSRAEEVSKLDEKASSFVCICPVGTSLQLAFQTGKVKIYALHTIVAL